MYSQVDLPFQAIPMAETKWLEQHQRPNQLLNQVFDSWVLVITPPARAAL
jgi:hypothetical protein